MNDHYMYVARWEQERKRRGARAQEAARVLRVDGTITKEEVLVVIRPSPRYEGLVDNQN